MSIIEIEVLYHGYIKIKAEMFYKNFLGGVSAPMPHPTRRPCFKVKFSFNRINGCRPLSKTDQIKSFLPDIKLRLLTNNDQIFTKIYCVYYLFRIKKSLKLIYSTN